MNAHELTAKKIVKDVYNDYVGGLENTLLDYAEDDEEYVSAKRTLEDVDHLQEMLYKFVMTEAERAGYAKHIKFAGREFIMDRINALLIRDGYRIA